MRLLASISALVSHKSCGGLHARDDVVAAKIRRVHGNNEDFDSKQTPVLFFQTRARAQNRMSMNLVVAPRSSWSSEKSDDQMFWSGHWALGTGHWALERRQPPELRPQLVILCRDLFAGSFKSPSNILSLAPFLF